MIYSVFKQAPAKIIPGRSEEYQVNFVYMGNVEASTSDKAFKLAHDKYCAAPVLQKGGAQS
jgi:hypothetical protein